MLRRKLRPAARDPGRRDARGRGGGGGVRGILMALRREMI